MVIYIKQAQTPAVSRHITDARDPRLLPARGPPHGDLAARPPGARRPVAGLDRAGRRPGSWSPRSPRTRWTWTGRDIDDPEEIAGGRRRPGPGDGHDARGGGRRERRTPWCRSPRSGPSTRRSRPTRTGFADAPGGLRARATAHGPAATTRSSSTCSATAGSRACRTAPRTRARAHRDPLGALLQERVTHSPRDGHIRDPAQSRTRGAVHGARRDALQPRPTCCCPGSRCRWPPWP